MYVVENQRFDFSLLAGAACVMTVPLAKGLDIGNATRVRALVRVYEAVIPIGAMFEVEVFQAWPTADEPKELFELIQPGAARTPILKGELPEVGGSDTRPTVVLVDGATTPKPSAEYVGPAIDVFLKATPASVAADFTCGITVALELWDA